MHIVMFWMNDLLSSFLIGPFPRIIFGVAFLVQPFSLTVSFCPSSYDWCKNKLLLSSAFPKTITIFAPTIDIIRRGLSDEFYCVDHPGVVIEFGPGP
jgi:hypothetical protein